MLARCLSFLVAAAAVLVLASVAPAKAAPPFYAVRTELTARKAALTGATDKASKKQLAAVSKALAKLEALDVLPAPSVPRNIAAAIAAFPLLEKAFPLEFPKGLAPTGALGTAVVGDVGIVTSDVEFGFNQLTSAISPLPPSKIRTSAQKQADTAGKALGAADVTTTPSKIAKLLKKAESAVIRGLATVAKAPVRNSVTATFGTVAFVGQNNYIDYFQTSGGFSLSSNANTAGLGGFASFDFSPFATSVTGPGDYPLVTGMIRVGVDPGNNTQYYISAGTMHLETFDTATQRATGTFTLTVTGHPEYSSVDGAFDFYSLRIQ